MRFFDINNIFFTLWGYPMSYLEFFGTVAGGVAVWLSAKTNIWSWPLGIINVVLFFFLFFQVQLYPDMFLMVFFCITNIIGWWRWANPNKGEEDRKNELKVSYLARRQIVIFSVIGIAGTLISGNLASRLHEWLPGIFNKPSAFPFIDSFVTVMSVVATFWMIQKKVECWILWIVIDVVATGMYFVKGIKFVSAEYFAFCFMAAFGLWNWIKENRSYFCRSGVKRGLVIGKFLPLHQGHIALIRFAAGQCDELIVSMSYTESDPIDPLLRFAWIRQTFQDTPGIRPEMVRDDFDDESLPILKRTAIWADFIKKRFPPVDVLFSSEEYGEPFARHLGVPHSAFDIQRRQVPVSASAIRSRPMTHWDYIPDVVRPYFVKKICFYGPESTGKTVLIERLGKAYKTVVASEVAREMIATNDFTEEDIIRIGYAQTERVSQLTRSANRILLCDTDVITTEIYSRRYLNKVPAILYELERQIQYDLYFLFDINVPWVADGMRDLSESRPEMYRTFRDELVIRKIPFINVGGSYSDREGIVRNRLDALLSDNT